MWEVLEIKRLLDWFDNNCDASIRAELIEYYSLVFNISNLTADKFSKLQEFLKELGIEWSIERHNDKVYLVVGLD